MGARGIWRLSPECGPRVCARTASRPGGQRARDRRPSTAGTADRQPGPGSAAGRCSRASLPRRSPRCERGGSCETHFCRAAQAAADVRPRTSVPSSGVRPVKRSAKAWRRYARRLKPRVAEELRRLARARRKGAQQTKSSVVAPIGATRRVSRGARVTGPEPEDIGPVCGDSSPGRAAPSAPTRREPLHAATGDCP